MADLPRLESGECTIPRTHMGIAIPTKRAALIFGRRTNFVARFSASHPAMNSPRQILTVLAFASQPRRSDLLH